MQFRSAKDTFIVVPPAESAKRVYGYRFRHILFQKYLYQRLDAAERVYFHEAIGTILETLYQSDTIPIAGQLARHFEEAGRVLKPIN